MMSYENLSLPSVLEGIVRILQENSSEFIDIERELSGWLNDTTRADFPIYQFQRLDYIHQVNNEVIELLKVVSNYSELTNPVTPVEGAVLRDAIKLEDVEKRFFGERPGHSKRECDGAVQTSGGVVDLF